MKIQRLARYHEAAVEELLEQDPAANLFLLGFLDAHSLDGAVWFGAVDGDFVRAVTLLVPGRIAVPYAPDPDLAGAIGQFMRPRYAPTMIVGPRRAGDALWTRWAGSKRADRFYDQRLYVCRKTIPGEPVAGFRRAHPDEAEVVAAYSGEMEAEDLGRDPRDEDPEVHLRVVRERIEAGRTYVIERDGQLVFQINVGTTTPWGCQVGGTYVPPPFRGHGLAVDGMRALCDTLLARFPMVTLHVNEANVPAVRTYERTGFERSAPFRLITVA